MPEPNRRKFKSCTKQRFVSQISYKPEQAVTIKEKLGARARHAVFHIAGSVAPTVAGRAAFELFCRPPVRPLDRGTERLIERMSPLFARAQARRVPFSDGSVQTYWWRTSNGSSRGRVLLVHGWTGRAMVMGLFVEPLLKAGFDVVAMDLPAHGNSSGSRLNMPIGARAVQAVARSFAPITSAITHSFGGPVMALALEGGPPLLGGLELDKVVLIAAPNKLTAMTDRFAKSQGLSAAVHNALNDHVSRAANRPIETVETGTLLCRARTPALIIHDESDADVPFDRAEAICASAPRATLMRTTGLGHTRIIISSAVVRASIRFLSAASQ
jgi:pimeloyl-ACP methyl ester carboxylesterase